MRRRALAIALLAVGCAASAQDVARAPESEVPRGSVAASEVMRELEALVCMMTFELPQGPVEDPIFGHREYCKLPPARTALERAVERAWADADPMLNAMRHEWRVGVMAAMSEPDADARLVAVRQAYLRGRVLGVLMADLEPALAREGLSCRDCPDAYVPQPRTIAWDELAPYLERYVWADPVETPRDAAGKATGEPHYGMHICVELNGMAELEDPDPALVELGFLATLHNDRLIDRAGELFRIIRDDPAFLDLRDDFLRVRWLRAQLGPRLLAEPAVRTSICETVERFRGDTGITIAECERSAT